MSQEFPRNVVVTDEMMSSEKLPKIPIPKLAGKTAFVTGGSSGIGLGIVKACIAADMNVALTFKTLSHWERAELLLKESIDRILPILLDVTDRKGMLQAPDLVRRRFGGTDILINNAGIDPGVSVSNASFDDLTWCLDVNVKGVFNSIKAFLPCLKANKDGGHIVTTASINGLVTNGLWGLYSASKFAVVGMMESLRAELLEHNIGVSVFCPGHVMSALSDSRRNRPIELNHFGTLDDSQQNALDAIRHTINISALKNGGAFPMLAADQAGKLVLKGILNNDLYIISHPEYTEAVRERSAALLASFASEYPATPDRESIAKLESSPIYADVLSRKSERYMSDLACD